MEALSGGNPLIVPLLFTLVGVSVGATLNNVFGNWSEFKEGVVDGFNNALR